MIIWLHELAVIYYVLLSHSVAYTPIMPIGYSGASCASTTALDYWGGGSSSAIDVMAYAAAAKLGYKATSYNFNVVFMPCCSLGSSSGMGWVGAYVVSFIV